MFLDTWNRLKDTLVFAQTQLALSSIVLTLPETVPRNAQAYEKFVAIIGQRPIGFTQNRSPQGESREHIATVSFPLDIYSEPILMDYDVRMVTNMFIVMDALVDTFNERPRLEGADGKGMKHIDTTTPVLLSNGVYNIQPYPVNTKDNRHHFGAIITVSYIWTCPTRQT